jgi:hypothetical protein
MITTSNSIDSRGGNSSVFMISSQPGFRKPWRMIRQPASGWAARSCAPDLFIARAYAKPSPAFASRARRPLVSTFLA